MTETQTGAQKLKAAGDDADQKGHEDVMTGAAECPPKGTHWLDVKLIDDDGDPVKDQRCVVVTSDGTEHPGKTDAKGMVHVDEVPEGPYTVRFLDLDGETWEHVD
jgi:hypothetical protein